MSHPLQQAHLVEVRAGVGQPLQSVCQVVVSAEVEAVRHQYVVYHGQEGLILLSLQAGNKHAVRRSRTIHLREVLTCFYAAAVRPDASLICLYRVHLCRLTGH